MVHKPKVENLVAASLTVAPPEFGTPELLPFRVLCLTTRYRRQVEAALPEGAVASDLFWSDLETAVTLYVTAQQRQTRRSPKAELARWRHVGELTDSLWRELKDEPLGVDGIEWLRKVHRHAADRAAYYEVVDAFTDRFRHPHRVTFYAAIIGMWHFHLGLPVRSSSKRDRYPARGPLVTFIAACAAPLLREEAPTPSTIDTIIKRHKKRPFMPWSLIAQASDTYDGM